MKPVLWIDCGIHAREWISPATCLYILDMLTSNTADARHILSKYDVHIMPVVNPDGYVYSWTRVSSFQNFKIIFNSSNFAKK